MEEVRQEVHALTQEVRGIRDDIAEIKRLLTGAYGMAKNLHANGNGQQHPTSLVCSRSPFQKHYKHPDGSCSCQHAPAWAKA
jgi:hypothetical protein